MKKCLLFVFAMILYLGSFAQISVVSGGSGLSLTYTSFTKADGLFAALNATPQSGAIVFSITGDITTEDGVVALAQGGWSSITITPSGARTVSGTVAGAPMLPFNGADFVTFDGLNDGTNSLVISNLSTAATTATSTIRLYADATDNKFTNCSILGSATVPLGTNGGNIFISTGTTTGNDNITISYCKIGPAGANLPSKGIYGNGSTTSAAIANSNVLIDHCEIFDFFLAGGCAGVYALTGNTDWTVTNNKIYQTASRAMTSTMSGIYFSNSTYGNNIQINLNTIGYASNSGTGTLTLTSTGSFQGIYLNALTTAALACNLNTNVISDISLTSASGTFYGIYNASGASSNTININNNYVKNIALVTTTGTFYGISWSSATNMTITGNYIYGITRNGIGSIYGIYSASSSVNENISGNYVYNMTSTAASAGTICGIYQLTSTGTKTFQNNVVHDLGGAVVSTLYGMYVAYGTTTAVNNNTIYSLSSTGGTAGVVTGLYLSTSATTMNVFSNKVCDLTSTSTGTLVSGILVGGGTTRNVYNNLIGNLTAPAANVADAIRGININSTTTSSTVNIYYNTVYINATSTGAIFGTSGIFHSASATATTAALTLKNNIIVNTSTANTTGFTVAYRRSAGTAGMLANYVSTSNYNDFYAGAPSATNLIYYDGTSSAQTIAAYKSGVFTAGTIAPRDAASISENPTFVNTTCGDAEFLHINTTTPTQLESGGANIATYTTDFDGNIRYGNAGYTGTGSAPDIGADEFNGVLLDLAPPVITYTPLTNTSVLGDRNLDVTITDASGIPVGTNQPVLYYKIGAGAWTGPLAPSAIAVPVYTYTFGAGAVTGDVVSYYVVAQDASPAANITSYPAGATVTPNPPTATAPPPSPSTYIIVDVPLNGDYTVGLTMFNKVSGQNIYFDKVVTKVMKEVFVEEPVLLKNNQKPATTDNPEAKNETVENTGSGTLPAGRMELREVEEVSWVPMQNGHVYNGPLSVSGQGNPNMPDAPVAGIYPSITIAVADLNLRGVSGPVRFLLTDATYTTGETYPITVNVTNSAVPTATNTVTIKPNIGVTSLIQCPSATASTQIFKIRNSYITIDGSNTIGGTTKDLTIENQYATTPQVIAICSSGTTPIVGVTVKNSIIINGSNGSTALVVSDLAGTAGYFNNITVQNNSIQKAYIGAYFIATVAAGNGSALITQNDLTTSGANAIAMVGIYCQGVDGAVVSKNNIANFEGTGAQDDKGVWFATGTVNSTIEKNYIYNLKYTSTGGYGSHGIAVSTGTTSANILVKNNMIYNISGDGYAYTGTYFLDNPYGIVIYSTQTGIKVYDNSINLYGNTLNQTSALSGGIVLGTGSVADVQGNIIVNNLGLLSATGYGAVGIYLQTAGTQLLVSDYNDILVTPTGSGAKYTGQIATTGYATLANWKTILGGTQESHSVSGDPKFILNTNLHIQPATPSVVSNAGVSLASVLDDIDGDPRPNPLDAPAFDIGADEYHYAPPPVDDPTGVVATAISSSEIDVAFIKNAANNNVVISWSADPSSFIAPSGTPPPVGGIFGGGRLVYNGGTSPAQHLGLLPVTHYYYKVWSYQYDGVSVYTYSPGVNTEAVTKCADLATISENFDGVVAPALPQCWTKYTSPTYTGQSVVTSTTSPLSPLNCASLYNSTATLPADAPMLITPPISNLAAHTHWLKFAAKGNGTTLSVIVGTVSDAGVFTPFATVTGLSATAWKSKFVDFSTYEGTDKYIAFQHPMTSTSTYVYIDDVSWEATSPTLFVDPTSLAFGFTPNGGTSAEQTYSLTGMFLVGTAGITVNAPAGFEVSLTTGAGFGPSVVVPNTGPALAATPVFVHFKPTLASTDYAGNITNAGGSATTVNVAVTGTTILTYCTSMASSTADEEIYSVTINGTTNAYNCTTVAPGPGSILNRYSNFFPLGSLTTIQQGAPVSFTVEENECDAGTFYSFGTGIWIDFNQDGDFTDAGEEVFKESSTLIGPRNITNSFTVPSGASLGQTVMRVTVAEGYSGATLTPCLAYSFGETEDYYVNITVATSPVLGALPTSLAFGYVPVGGTSVPQSYALTGLALPNNGSVTVTAPTGFLVCETLGGTYTSGLTIPYTGTTVSKTIYAEFSPGSAGNYSDNITNVAGAASANVGVTGTTTITYCPAGSATCDEYISRVQLNTIDNSTACSTGGYADYSAISTALTSGSGTLITVTNGLPYASDQCGIWIDWNNNGVFTDAGEAITVVGTPGVGPYTATITPPTGAVETGVRMRIRICYTTGLSPCGIASYGEVEDYTVTITPPLALDAGVVSLDNVAEINAPGTIIVPKATVKNYGTTDPITFDVTIQGTDGYASTVTGVTLAAGAQTQVTFANWTPVAGVWSLQVCTQLTGDMNNLNNCKSQKLLIFSAPNKQVYAYNAYANTGTDPEGPTTFNLSSPGTLNSLADQSTLDFVDGGTWANGLWYGSVYAAAIPYPFVTLDPVTGARTVLGDMGIRIPGISYNTVNGIMYGLSPTDLYTINMTTGAITLVGGANTGRYFQSFAISNTGQAYALDYQNSMFGSINLTTGVFTPIGDVGFTAAYAQDMEFDRESGVLYMAAETAAGNGFLGYVDITSGHVFNLGNFEGTAEITGFAIPYSSTPLTKTLNLKVYLEGLCMDRDLGSGLVPPPAGEMYEALNDMGVPNFAPGIADKVTVELHDVANYANPPVLTFPDVDLSTTGNISITGIDASYNGTYYITIKHRSSIETPSAEGGVSFTADVINYDFSTAASQAYLDNQKSIHSVFAIFGGNPNQDPIGDNQLLVDSGDMNDVENASAAITFGYVVTDCNGDGIVDSGDMNLVENNSASLVSVITP